MRKSFATKLLSIAMMLIFPAAMLVAETGNTMLYASGNVMLNGKEVSRSASVAAGDKIETAGTAATAVSTDGSKVVVSPYSAIRYQSEGVSVVKGAAAITTSEGMPVQAAQITITPKDKAATYEVARLDNNIVITSHTGALMITDAGKTSEMDAGSSSSRAAATPAPAPAPQAAPVFPGSTLTGYQVFTIGAVVGGAAIVCGLWCGMAAAHNAPVNGAQTATAMAIASHQGRAMAHIIQVARVASVPLVNGVRNQAVSPAQARGAVVQHRGVRAVQAGR
jgi:hypothetical protein